jgi:hypothetical protein
MNAKTHMVGSFGGIFHSPYHCLDWYLYSLLSIGVALYLLALGKSHTLNWENKDMSKNLYPQDLIV